MRALACPASLKGVLAPAEAAAQLAAGLRGVAGIAVEELPVADGGDGTADVLAAALGGEWRTAVVSDPLGRPVVARFLLLPDGTAVVESAQAIGLTLLRADELDPFAASSAGLGELLLATLAARPSAILVCLGGTATVDGGAGMRAIVGGWLRGTRVRVACDVASPLLGERGAAYAYGPQKGATRDGVHVLEERIARIDDLAPYRALPGAGAGGGLGAAFAALGADLVPGSELVLDLIGFDDRARGADLVVTAEGTVDSTTIEGKAPAAVARRCAALGVRCVVAGGVVVGSFGFETRALSGDPSLAAEDLVQLGEELALELAAAPG